MSYVTCHMDYNLYVTHLRFGLKIWLTEFAKCCTKDETEVSDFMKVMAVT